MQRYSDLVLESCMAAGTLPGGVTVEEQTEEEVEVSIVRITDEEGEKAVGKPRGSYVTLTAPHMAGSDPEIDKRCAKALAKQLRAMMPKNNKQRPVLLVGLGNRSMTPDSLGICFHFGRRTCKRQAMFASYRPAFWGKPALKAAKRCWASYSR